MPVNNPDLSNCTCYVRRLNAQQQWELRYGAHAVECPVYRPSRDPVDEANDIEARAFFRTREQVRAGALAEGATELRALVIGHNAGVSSRNVLHDEHTRLCERCRASLRTSPTASVSLALELAQHLLDAHRIARRIADRGIGATMAEPHTDLALILLCREIASHIKEAGAQLYPVLDIDNTPESVDNANHADDLVQP